MKHARFFFSCVLTVVLAATFASCRATSKAGPAVPPIESGGADSTPNTRAEIFREVMDDARRDSQIKELERRLENFKVIRLFWLNEKKRAEHRQGRIARSYPRGVSGSQVVEAQRRNLYEINLSRERVILIDEYLVRLEKEATALENERRELIAEKIRGGSLGEAK